MQTNHKVKPHSKSTYQWHFKKPSSLSFNGIGQNFANRQMKRDNQQTASDTLYLGVTGMRDTADSFAESDQEKMDYCSNKLGYETIQMWC